MTLRNRFTNRNPLMCVGLMFLALGNTSHYFLQRFLEHRLSENLNDRIFGLLMGIAFGCLLLSLRQPPRRTREDNSLSSG